jgi:hypothetical protein
MYTFRGFTVYDCSSHCLTVNVPYVHLLPKYGHQLAVSLPPDDNHYFSLRLGWKGNVIFHYVIRC